MSGYCVLEDGVFLHPDLNSTPDASNQRTKEHYLSVGNTEGADLIIETQAIMFKVSSVYILYESEDSRVF